MHTTHELAHKGLINELPSLDYKYSSTCDACIKGKLVRSSFKPKKIVSTSTSGELLHINLCRPMQGKSVKGKFYILVIVEDYSRFYMGLFSKGKRQSTITFLKMLLRDSNSIEASY